jgi:hypothetical protein
LVRLLLDCGADKMVTDHKGYMAVDHAGIQRNMEIIELLS